MLHICVFGLCPLSKQVGWLCFLLAAAVPSPNGHRLLLGQFLRLKLPQKTQVLSQQEPGLPEGSFFGEPDRKGTRRAVLPAL